MPVGKLTEEEFEEELRSLRRSSYTSNPNDAPSVLEGEIVDKPHKGRSEGDNNVPDPLRKIIGETAVIDGRQEALKLAAQFGVSPSQVSAYANGATSTATYDTPSKSIIQHINQSRQRAIKKASKTLNSALGAITQEKLDYTDAKDLSAIAKNMSAIIKDLEPPQESQTKPSDSPRFIIYAPQFKKEETFEVITVNE